MKQPKIISHNGDAYTLYRNGNACRDIYYSIHKTRDPRCSKPYDMCIAVGGMVMFINADGTMVHGYETFDKKDLKTAYDYLNGDTIQSGILGKE